MSWFKKNPVEVVIEEKLPSPDELLAIAAEKTRLENEKKALVAVQAPLYRAMPKMELVEKLGFLEREVQQTCTVPSALSEEERPSYTRCLESIAFLKRLWMQIETDQLDDESCSYLYTVITESLPEAIEFYQYRVFDVGRTKAWQVFGMTHKRDADGNLIWNGTKLIEDVYIEEGLYYTVHPVVEKLRGFKKSASSTTAAVVPSQNGFPRLSSDDEILLGKLTNLEQLWLTATASCRSVDDKYFVEQIISRYLPESWSLYISFQQGSEELQKQAHVVFCEQLDLLEAKLRDINDSFLKANLDAMQAQSEFLKEKILEPALSV